MSRIHSSFILGICLLMLSACSKDLPESFKAIPASTKLVATIDTAQALQVLKTAAGKLAPEKAKLHAERIKALNQQLMDLLGVDMHKIKNVIIMGDPDHPTRYAFLVEGLRASNLPVKSGSAYKGIKTQSLAFGLAAAELPEVGLLLASSQAGLKTIIDTWKGDAKRLADTDQGKALERMLSTDKDLNLLRVYLLGVKVPEIPMIKLNFHAAGFFLHSDRGAMAAMLTDEASAKDLASTLRRGVSSLQMVMALGSSQTLGDDSPIPLDKATQDALARLVSKLTTARDKDLVKVSCRANLNPLLAKATEVGWDHFQAEMAPE